MKKIIFILTLILIFGIIKNLSVFAHGIEEEAKGKVIWEKLEAKELNCENLSNDDFEALGEYFMGQMTGTSHEAMNKMMEQMMGKKGEEEMHIVMGKRMSGCEPDTQMPQNMMNMMPMMGNWSNPIGFSNPMMNFGWWNWFSWIFMILFWILVIVGIVALIIWLINQIRGEHKGKSALDMLKERYAGGEISKEEFEEKKRDLSS